MQGVVSSDVYNKKADKATAGNFEPVTDANPGKIKSRAIKLCEGACLTKMAASVRKTERNTLSVFSAKTHKGGCPFRVIVSERGTWQRHLSTFLQKELSSIEVDDPCLVRKPHLVDEFLLTARPKNVSGFSVDVKDLYYSLPQKLVEMEQRAHGRTGVAASHRVPMPAASGRQCRHVVPWFPLLIRTSDNQRLLAGGYGVGRYQRRPHTAGHGHSHCSVCANRTCNDAQEQQPSGASSSLQRRGRTTTPRSPTRAWSWHTPQVRTTVPTLRACATSRAPWDEERLGRVASVAWPVRIAGVYTDASPTRRMHTPVTSRRSFQLACGRLWAQWPPIPWNARAEAVNASENAAGARAHGMEGVQKPWGVY
ncbi:hypothetical protein HPB48_024932 [Haemaphysalis longicornis]|uniref:Tick transposon n=1 Tax=Haemaphysalis longicornis TaxID=44386 RepID=A0A9J6H9L8_HAELO|nr:hypothetical protein HPB48_024932 [Haemaphysalis longicornis]